MTSVPSTAPNGGAWCMEMPAGNTQGCFPGQVIQVLPGIADGEMYTFSGWCRNVPSPFGPFIGLSLGTTNQGVVTPLGTAQWTSDTAWTYLSATDTFFLGVGDTAAVHPFLRTGGGTRRAQRTVRRAYTDEQHRHTGACQGYRAPLSGIRSFTRSSWPPRRTAPPSGLRDARGSLVQQGRYDPRGIDVSKLPAGLYLIECDQRVARFLKQ